MGLGIVYENTCRFSKAEATYKDLLGMLKAIPGTEIDRQNALRAWGISIEPLVGSLKLKQILKML